MYMYFRPQFWSLVDKWPYMFLNHQRPTYLRIINKIIDIIYKCITNLNKVHNNDIVSCNIIVPYDYFKVCNVGGKIIAPLVILTYTGNP